VQSPAKLRIGFVKLLGAEMGPINTVHDTSSTAY